MNKIFVWEFLVYFITGYLHFCVIVCSVFVEFIVCTACVVFIVGVVCIVFLYVLDVLYVLHLFITIYVYLRVVDNSFVFPFLSDPVPYTLRQITSLKYISSN